MSERKTLGELARELRSYHDAFPDDITAEAAERLEAIEKAWQEANDEQSFLAWIHKRLPALKAAITGKDS